MSKWASWNTDIESMLGVVLCVPIDSFFSSSLIVLLNPVTILYHSVACVFLSLLAVWNDPQTILQDIRACVQKDYFVFSFSFLFLWAFFLLEKFFNISVHFFPCFNFFSVDLCVQSDLHVWCMWREGETHETFRVGKTHRMPQEEVEGEYSCEEPWSAIGELGKSSFTCLQLRMVLWLEWLRLTSWFLHMVEMPFLYVIFSSHYAEGEKASAKDIEIGNVNYSFFGWNSDAASANVGCWSYWTCLWTTGHNCTSQATRAGSAISPRWWDQESWTCCWMSSSPEGFQTVFLLLSNNLWRNQWLTWFCQVGSIWNVFQKKFSRIFYECSYR